MAWPCWVHFPGSTLKVLNAGCEAIQGAELVSDVTLQAEAGDLVQSGQKLRARTDAAFFGRQREKAISQADYAGLACCSFSRLFCRWLGS